HTCTTLNHFSSKRMYDTRQPEPTLQSAVDRMMPSIASELDDARKGSVRCVVVTPEKQVLDESVEMVILPMFDGELGVQPGRAPIIGRLGPGELRLKSGTAVERWFVEAGFVQVRSNVVTVLTARAVDAATITPEMATTAAGGGGPGGGTAAAAEAGGLPGANAVERANKGKARGRAQGLKKVAAKNRGVGAPGSHA